MQEETVMLMMIQMLLSNEQHGGSRRLRVTSFHEVDDEGAVPISHNPEIMMSERAAPPAIL
jgi:hypothetical protein